MLDTAQVHETGRRVAWYAMNRTQLPTDGQFITVNGGQVPNFIDQIIDDVVNGRPFGPDNVQVNLAGAVPTDLNEDYDGPILFEEGDDESELILTLQVPADQSIAACKLEVNRGSGTVTFNNSNRDLPDGYELDLVGRNIGAPSISDDQRTITLVLPVTYDDPIYEYKRDDDDDDVVDIW